MYDRAETNDSLREQLFQDGVTIVRNLWNGDDLELLKSAISDTQNRPSPFHYTLENDNGRFFMDYNNWKRIDSVSKACTAPVLLDAVSSLTGSKSGRLFHDHVLIKSGQSEPTPWHHDRPYYIAKGRLNVSVWSTVDHVELESGMMFWRGSHKDQRLFIPRSFRSGKNLDPKKGFTMLEDAMIPEDQRIQYEMFPGDAAVFFHTTVHCALPHRQKAPRRALSVRFLLDGSSLTEKYINATPPYDRMGVKVTEDGDIPETFFPKVFG